MEYVTPILDMLATWKGVLILAVLIPFALAMLHASWFKRDFTWPKKEPFLLSDQFHAFWLLVKLAVTGVLAAFTDGVSPAWPFAFEWLSYLMIWEIVYRPFVYFGRGMYFEPRLTNGANGNSFTNELLDYVFGGDRAHYAAVGIAGMVLIASLILRHQAILNAW